MLLATTLLVYLVMPNDLAVPVTAPQDSSAADLRSGPVLSDVIHDDSGRPMAFSDEVTMPPRDLPQAHPPSAERDPAWHSHPAVPSFSLGHRAGAETVSDGALAALSPQLDDLQILRC
ncbi:hypothetical protein ACFYVL_09350 [Streptomyces sp. NPDC004111]|uniref:hypothetical protein n=1 Tax=Streptomyces sp. NPDC004111 TaxID=3364690 RepID=UPI00367D0D87